MAALADNWEDSDSEGGGWEDDASDEDAGDGESKAEEELTAAQSLDALVSAFEIHTQRSFRTGECQE